MMQMEWCNQFDSSISIHNRREGEKRKRVVVVVVVFDQGFHLYSCIFHATFKESVKTCEDDKKHN